MKWELDETKSLTFFNGEAESGGRVEAMSELWRVFVRDVIPKNEGVEWDYIRVEFWIDSARFIVFPANSERARRIERAGCQVHFPELQARYEKLLDSELDDERLSEQLELLQNEWMEALELSVKRSGIKGLNVRMLDSDDEDSMRIIEL